MINGLRTVSDAVAVVFANSIPVDILADQMRRIYVRRQTLERRNEHPCAGGSHVRSKVKREGGPFALSLI